LAPVAVAFASAGVVLLAVVLLAVVVAAAFFGAAAAFFGATFLRVAFFGVAAFGAALLVDCSDAASPRGDRRAGVAAGGCSSLDELITVTVPAAGITVVSSCDGQRIRSIDPITAVMSPSRSGPFPDDRRIR
jgi:hypothetical protein